MTKLDAPYAQFLGVWALIPQSCQYEQGDPPAAGSYRIDETDGRLVFTIEWTEAGGKEQTVTFSGVPDGEARPFEGGDLADALSVTLVSDRELRSSAFYRGKERMVAQRQLDASGQAMRVVQLVRFGGGDSAANIAVYRRVVEH